MKKKKIGLFPGLGREAFLFLLMLFPGTPQASSEWPLSSWNDVADYLAEEGRTEEWSIFRSRALKELPENLQIFQKILTHSLEGKNREEIFLLFQDWARGNECQKPSKICQALASLWKGHMDSIFFYNESDLQLEKARRLLGSKDCSQALGVLKEILSKEGETYRVLTYLKQGYACIHDTDGLAKTQTKLNAMRIFE